MLRLRSQVKMAQNTNKINYYNIDPLNSDNYEAWKFRVKMILTEHNEGKDNRGEIQR